MQKLPTVTKQNQSDLMYGLAAIILHPLMPADGRHLRQSQHISISYKLNHIHDADVMLAQGTFIVSWQCTEMYLKQFHLTEMSQTKQMVHTC